MKTLFTLCLLMFCLLSNCQYNYITLKHKTKRSKIVEIDSKELIKVVTKDGNSSFGQLAFITDPIPGADSMFIVGNDTIKISDILRIRNFPVGFRYAGAAMITLGLPIFLLCAAALPAADIVTGLFALAMSAVGGSTAITGSIFLLLGDHFSMEKWELSIN